MAERARETLIESVAGAGAATASSLEDRGRGTPLIAVREYPNLDSVPADVTAFIDSVGGRYFCASAVWFRAVLATAGLAIDRPRVYVAASAAGVLAVLIVRERTNAGPLKMRVVSSPSRGMDAAIYAPLLDPEHGEPGLRAIVRSMVRGKPPVHVVRLECFDPESPDFATLVKLLREFHLRVETFADAFSTYSEDVHGLTIEQYLAVRAPEMQEFMSNQLGAFAATGRGRFEVVTGGRDLAPALVDYALIDLQSWKEQELFPDCLARVVDAAAKAGVLRLCMLYVDDRPAAAQIWIVSGGRATMWRSHFGRQFAVLALGAVVTYEAIRHILASERPSRLEFGPATDTGRQEWLSRRCQRINFIAFNLRTAKGWAALARHYLGISARSAVQRIRQRRDRLLGRTE